MGDSNSRPLPPEGSALSTELIVQQVKYSWAGENCQEIVNLADDIIEPWRAMVDQMAYRMTNNDILLNSKERKEIVEVLHCNCKIGGKKMWIATGIELMADSLKAAIMKKDPEKLELPLLTDFS